MITLKNISKKYPSKGKEEFLALDDVSIFIKKGSIFGIIGESGAGKSSLLRCINLLERPSAGEVFVGKTDLTKLSLKKLNKERKNISMIFQHFNLLSSLDVFDNVALPLKFLGRSTKAIKEAVLPLLELTGLKDKVHHFPNQLSGGQKQRVAIARALATNPKVLLSDESTSALDPNTTSEILALLKKINEDKGVTIVLVTHQLEVIKEICHDVALMEKGKVLEKSSVIDFFAHPKTSLGQKLVDTSLRMEVSALLKDSIKERSESSPYPVVRLLFRGKMVKQAVISQASRKFDVDISILQSNIEFIQEGVVGFLLAQVRSPKEKAQKCLEFFEQNHLEYEVLGYAS